MIRKTTYKDNLKRHAVCALGLLISLATLPAYAQQIHQLSYNGSNWTDQNLNGAPADQWAISAFFTTPNDQMHVFYGAVDTADLHQLFYNGISWADLDLNQAAPGVCSYFGISGFSVANYQYVYYIDAANYEVHQMLYNNAQWVDTDLSYVSGASVVSYAGSNVIAFTTTPALHVFYTSDDSHVHQLYATNGTNWTAGPGPNQPYRRSSRQPQ